jgi:hypothetical protein
MWIETEDILEEVEDTTVSAVYDSIETNLWQAEGYFAKGAASVAMECLRSAWQEYLRFRDVLVVYGGTEAEELGTKLVRTLVARAGDSAETLALGSNPGATHVWQELAAAA